MLVIAPSPPGLTPAESYARLRQGWLADDLIASSNGKLVNLDASGNRLCNLWSISAGHRFKNRRRLKPVGGDWED